MNGLAQRIPFVPMVYQEARRAGFWALHALWLALWRFALRAAIPNRTSRELLLTLGLLGRILPTDEQESS